ncbi:hypothetical protein MTR67_022607 [Solanum verrucosum]|uniref:Uncharacterized protein n=1 Tax=Solanum verrucosum TaxID=315347 RepID=A0AAF0QV60_SOLVR|nr:hypothetical protein MTR67_022607 [Solanum verrucosum]
MQLGISERGVVLASIEVRDTFIEEINAKQFKDENLEELRKKTVMGKAQEATLDAEGGTHGHHPRTVDGLTVRPAVKPCRADSIYGPNRRTVD